MKERHTYIGKKNTISPAIGPYDIQTFYNIDAYDSVTGIGVTGSDTLSITFFDVGVTGINDNNFTNLKHRF